MTQEQLWLQLETGVKSSECEVFGGFLVVWLIVSERECVTQRLRSYLQQEVRGVVDEHHQRPDPDVVGAVRETQQEDGGEVMDNLFFEILKQNEWKRTKEYQ